MVRVRSLVYIFVFVAMMLPGKRGIFQYFDELVTLFFLLVILKNAMYKAFWKRSPEIPIILFSLLFLLLGGMAASAKSNLGQPLQAVLIDAFSILKYPIAYLAGKYCVYRRTREEFAQILYYPVILVVCAAFLLGLWNLVQDIGMSYDVRFGIRSFCFIYKNPGNLGALMFTCMAVLALDPKRRRNKPVICMAEIVIIMTLRAGCIGALGAFLIARLFTRKKIKVWHMLIASIAAIGLGYRQLNTYILDDDSLRKELIRGGISVYEMYKPLGAGFAAFGSDMAYDYYSPLYYRLGYHKIWGLSLKNGKYINDNFWPMIIGQLGILGMVCYLAILGIQLWELMRLKVSRARQCHAFAIYVLLVIGSLGAAIYTSVMGVHLGLILGMLESDDMEEW